MARLQFRSATQQKGFAPIQLSRASLSEMEKRDAKLLDALERKHKAEMDQRVANLKAMEDNAEYTERRFAENRKIEVANQERQQSSLNQIAARDEQQAKYDQQAAQTGLDTIVNLSATLQKTADRRTAKQLEDQTALAMAEDLDPYEQILYEGNFDTVKRANIQANSLIQREGAQSGEPLHKTFKALAGERGLGLIGQRVLLNRLYVSSNDTFYNQNLKNDEKKYQLPNGTKFSGIEALEDPEKLAIVQSTTRSEVDTLMRNKYGITEALFFSKGRGIIEEQNKIRINQAETKSIEIYKQIGNDTAEELFQAGEYDNAYHTKLWATDPKRANERVRELYASTNDPKIHEGLDNITLIDNNTGKEVRYIDKFPEQVEEAKAKGRRTELAVFEAEQKYKKDKRKQLVATNIPTFDKLFQAGGLPAIEDFNKVQSSFGIPESDYHPAIKRSIASAIMKTKDLEEEDLRMAKFNGNLTAARVASYENNEVRTAAEAILDEQEARIFGANHKAERAAIVEDAKDRTNVTEGGNANSKTSQFVAAYVREIKKRLRLKEGSQYLGPDVDSSAKKYVDDLVLKGEKGLYHPVTNPNGASKANPFVRISDEQNNYTYPYLHGIETDEITYNDNLVITQGSNIFNRPYAVGTASEWRQVREDILLNRAPIYPYLFERAIDQLNSNPRYQNNKLDRTVAAQMAQDAINKIEGGNYQIMPVTEEQNYLLGLPAPLYKKLTSGNLLQHKFAENVARGTVGQNLRPSMGGNSGTFGDIVNTARASGAKFPELVAAQWALESNFGKAPSGMNNFFGMKATPNETSTSRMTTEYRDGALNTESANFKDYASKEDSVNDLVNRWYKNYESYQGINNANSIEEAAQMLQQQGYATDPDYANKLIQILKNNIGRQ